MRAADALELIRLAGEGVFVVTVSLQAGGRRREAYRRNERSKPFRTLEVSTHKADSSLCEGSGRNPRRNASPTWYSTSRAEP